MAKRYPNGIDYKPWSKSAAAKKSAGSAGTGGTGAPKREADLPRAKRQGADDQPIAGGGGGPSRRTQAARSQEEELAPSKPKKKGRIVFVVKKTKTITTMENVLDDLPDVDPVPKPKKRAQAGLSDKDAVATRREPKDATTEATAAAMRGPGKGSQGRDAAGTSGVEDPTQTDAEGTTPTTAGPVTSRNWLSGAARERIHLQQANPRTEAQEARLLAVGVVLDTIEWAHTNRATTPELEEAAQRMLKYYPLPRSHDLAAFREVVAQLKPNSAPPTNTPPSNTPTGSNRREESGAQEEPKKRSVLSSAMQEVLGTTSTTNHTLITSGARKDQAERVVPNPAPSQGKEVFVANSDDGESSGGRENANGGDGESRQLSMFPETVEGMVGSQNPHSPSNLHPDLKDRDHSHIPASQKSALSQPEARTHLPVYQPSVQITMEQERESAALQEAHTENIERELAKVKTLPDVHCSVCAIGTECPEFREGYACAYDDAVSAFSVRDPNLILASMAEIVDSNQKRLRRGMLEERIINGGSPRPDITQLSTTVLQQMEMIRKHSKVVERATVTVQGEEPARAGTGLVAQLMQNMMRNNAQNDSRIGAVITVESDSSPNLASPLPLSGES